MRPGDTVEGNGATYRIQEEILEGGKAQSYRATNGTDDVFLKRLIGSVYPTKRGRLSDQAYQKKLLAATAFEDRHREIMMRLDEQVVGGGNLVKPLDMFRSGGNFFKVYPFINAQTCETITKATPEVKAIFVRTLLLCVFELHRKDIVHSDLKPDNVLVHERAVTVARLIDFDDAYLSRQAPRRMSGDPVYFSPEQFEFIERTGDPNRMTTKSDIFALALVLLVIATGKFPTIPGGSGDSPAERILTGGTPNKIVLPGFSDDFSHALRQSLAEDPNDRPSIVTLLRHVDVDVGTSAAHLDTEHVPLRLKNSDDDSDIESKPQDTPHRPSKSERPYFVSAITLPTDSAKLSNPDSTSTEIDINVGRKRPRD